MKINFPGKSNGFTLIELSIALVMMGILAASVIGSLTTRIETSRQDQAVEELEKIKKVLLGYAYSQANPTLPCPDCIKKVADGDCPGVGAAERDGVGDYNANACSVATGDVGSLPWVTLGSGSSDPWGARYRYWVDPNYANTLGFSLSSGAGIGVIEEPDFAVVTVPPGGAPKNLANEIVAVIFSHGRNKFGGISSDNVNRPAVPVANIDEGNNDDDVLVGGEALFVSRTPTAPGANIWGGEFDDIVVWISEKELKAGAVRSRRLP